jgi:energy-coupling factor transporter ATP-binding protein EcfA2
VHFAHPAPSVVFADEPTGALDLVTGAEVLGLLGSLVRAAGATVVMVTHDPVAASRADRVVFLADGRIAGEILRPEVDAVAARMAHLADRAARPRPPRLPGRSHHGIVGLAVRSVRHQPAAFAASFLTLALSAFLVAVCGGVFETGLTSDVPPQRLLTAPVVVTGVQDYLGTPLPSSRPVPLGNSVSYRELGFYCRISGVAGTISGCCCRSSTGC